MKRIQVFISSLVRENETRIGSNTLEKMKFNHQQATFKTKMLQRKAIESFLTFSLISCLICSSFCCFYEGQQVETSLNNKTFVESARSTVECTLRCQRLKKTPFFTGEKKCFCLDGGPINDNSANATQTGTLFEKV